MEQQRQVTDLHTVQASKINSWILHSCAQKKWKTSNACAAALHQYLTVTINFTRIALALTHTPAPTHTNSMCSLGRIKWCAPSLFASIQMVLCDVSCNEALSPTSDVVPFLTRLPFVYLCVITVSNTIWAKTKKPTVIQGYHLLFYSTVTALTFGHYTQSLDLQTGVRGPLETHSSLKMLRLLLTFSIQSNKKINFSC